jgi:7-cyano-7-deazaguanine reductase
MTNEWALTALGQKTRYDNHYHPDLLFAISRQPQREALGLFGALPFFGVDLWNHYEVSWLNAKGKPVVALAEILYGCESTYLIESKSMKLYFNSFNQTPFQDVAAVKALVQRDLVQRLGIDHVQVTITPLSACKEETLFSGMEGTCLDELDVDCSVYSTQPNFLTVEEEEVEETVYSNLLKSNCLVTHQPDWCSVQITYKGKKINHAGLLRYIVSYRDSQAFHEPCIEKIFMHLMHQCQPQTLTVYGRSTRRGGLDVNAYRSTQPTLIIPNKRLCRQ